MLEVRAVAPSPARCIANSAAGFAGIVITHGPLGPVCFLFNINLLQNKSFIRYAALHCSGSARSRSGALGIQLGGMRLGLDQAPSRIFFNAILIAIGISKRRKAPCSTAQTTAAKSRRLPYPERSPGPDCGCERDPKR